MDNSFNRGVDLNKGGIPVEKLQAGDRQAFAALVDEYQDMVYNVTLKMVHNRELAEDLCQETFIKVYKGLPSFRGKSSLSTWIYRIAYNVCVSEMQKARYRHEDSRTGDLDRGEVTISRHTSDATDPLRELERTELKQNVAGLIERLKPRQRLAIMLHYQGDQSYQEISEIMDVPIGTVKTLLFRAKESLRERLLKDGIR